MGDVLMAGPLRGLRVLELGGIGPGPFACMLLADMGADVIRIERSQGSLERSASSFLHRGKRAVVSDVKAPGGLDDIRDLILGADVLVEGFRPGAAERMGLGPQECLALRPSLVYGRISGWGSTGPLAQAAGHDLNYIALAGVLHSIGERCGPPVPPLAYVGDYGGGAMSLVVGILGALWEARSSGKGQVVDASILDGALLLTTHTRSFLSAGRWIEERGENSLDGGAPFYGVYKTADGEYISLAALEPKFYQTMVTELGLDPADLPDQHDRAGWPRLRQAIADVVATKTRGEWTALLEGTDACFAPVLTMTQSQEHPHNVARGAFVRVGDALQPAPTPRYSRTPSDVPRPLRVIEGRASWLAAS
jgi:alpha-methylacyl-CoA racemase